MSTPILHRTYFRWLFFLAAIAHLPAFAQDCGGVKREIERLHPRFKYFADNDRDSGMTLSRRIVNLALRCPDSNAFYLLDALRFQVERHPSLDSSAHFLALAEGFVEKYAHLLNGEQHLEVVLTTRYNRCRNMTLHGLYDQATGCFEDLENAFPDSVTAPVLISMRYLIPSQLGAQQYGKGNYPEALRWNYEALNRLEKTHSWYLLYKGVAHFYLGQCHFQLGERTEARRQFFQSVNAFLQVEPAKRETTDDYLLDTYLELCDFYLAANQPDSALAMVNGAFSLDLQEEWNLPFAYRKKAEILTKQGKHEEALASLNQASGISVALDEGRHLQRGLLFKAFGEYHFEKGDYQKALVVIQRGLEQLNDSFPFESRFDQNPDLKSTPSPKELLSLLHLKARALAAQANEEPTEINWLRWSLETYSAAVQLLQILRTDYDWDESKELLSQHSFALFEEGIEVCRRLFLQTGQAAWQDSAFLFSEKSKALSLLESLAGSRAIQFAGIPDSLLSLETELQLQLAFFDRMAQTAADSQEVKNARSLAFRQRRKLDELRHFLKDSFPDYFKLKYGFPAMSIRELQGKLAADETFVEYFWGDRHLYFFTVSKNAARFDSLHPPANLRQNLEDFKNLSASAEELSRGGNVKKHQRLGFWLYRELVEPLKIATPKVLLAADAWLNLLPFDALSTDSLTQKDFSQFPFLIRRMQITKVFSAAVFGQQLSESQTKSSVLQQATTGKTKPGVPPSVLKNKPQQKPQKNLLVISPQFFGGKKLPGRPDSLAHRFGGDALLGEKVTKAAVFEQAPKYRRLLFYSHAKADTIEPYVRLFGDERLFLRDLYARRLPVKLVLLAACEAGTGKFKRGEGILSLARGFAYGGVPAVSLTLWEVRGGTTLFIVEHFLQKHLTEGLPPGDAMHRAKLEFLKNPPLGDASPHLWAGFVMVGK